MVAIAVDKFLLYQLSAGSTQERYIAISLYWRCKQDEKAYSFFLSIFTGSLIYEHYTRECEFGNFDKIKNTKKQNNTKKTQKLLAEFLFK